MKTRPAMLQISVFFLTMALGGVPAFSQPGGPPRINPATGLPASQSGKAATPPRINPATGLPAAAPGELTPEGGVTEAYEAANELRKLMLNRRHEEALRCCVAFHDKWQTSASLIPLLQDWVELGRRYPEARAALLQIRDRGVREFSDGRGYFALFMEVCAINNYLPDENSTYALYKSFRDKDPVLAAHCYGMVEGSMIARGEHQWCYDHMGDPQAKFEGIRRRMDERLEQYKRSRESDQRIRQRIAEEQQRRGLTNLPSFTPPDPNIRLNQAAKDDFVGQTCQLIEILVATGHTPAAQKIRDQAVAVVDDPRLRSAVSDAERRTKTLQ